MSDIMRPMAFEQLLNWILTEKSRAAPCSENIIRIMLMRNITARSLSVRWRRGRACSRTAHPAGPEHCGGILYGEPFL